MRPSTGRMNVQLWASVAGFRDRRRTAHAADRLAVTEHAARPWRIHQIAPDFRLEDVWAFHTPGAGADDFPLLLTALHATGGLNEDPLVSRFLCAARWKLGAPLGWDEPQAGPAGRVDSLCDRLPPDLRQDGAPAPVPNTPFTVLYELPDECAIELATKTVHAICHLGWVPTDDGEYRLQMAALVRPNGLLGRLYLTAIKPVRYLIVYPSLSRMWERAWRNRDSHTGPGPSAEVRQAGPDLPNLPWSSWWPPTSGQTRQGRVVLPRTNNGDGQMVTWAGRLIVLYGTAHTLGALTALGAARHAGAWFRQELWSEDLSDMSPAMSAYWLSVNSFGPPLILVGLTVLWLNRRGITPPPFLPWSMGGWVVVGTVLAGPGVGQDLILLAACGLLLAVSRRARRRDALSLQARPDTISAAGCQMTTPSDLPSLRGAVVESGSLTERAEVPT